MAPPPPPKPGGTYRPQPTSIRKMTLAGDLVLDPAEIAGKSIAFLGTTGSGKSTTVRRALEQALSCGIPFTVADIENEYIALKELGEVIVAGPPDPTGKIKPDVTLTNPKQCYALAQKAYRQRRSVILLLGELDEDLQRLFLRSYCDGIFHAANDPDHRFVHILVLEEIQEWAPQVGIAKDDPLLKAIIRISKRGRKRGLSLWPVSQRPANVDKNVLTQCQIFFAHFVSYATDMNTYKTLFKVEDLEKRMNAFVPGDVLYKNGKDEVFTHISLPTSKSPSNTPGAIDPSKFKHVEGAQTIEEEIKVEEDRDSISVVDTNELRRLQEENQQYAEEVEQLRQRVATTFELQASLEAQIRVLQESKTVTLTADLKDVAAMQREIADLTQRANKAEALALPIKLMLGLLEQEKTNGQ